MPLGLTFSRWSALIFGHENRTSLDGHQSSWASLLLTAVAAAAVAVVAAAAAAVVAVVVMTPRRCDACVIIVEPTRACDIEVCRSDR